MAATCDACGQAAPRLKTCGSCLAATYCCKECQARAPAPASSPAAPVPVPALTRAGRARAAQRAHWPEHKAECRRRSTARLYAGEGRLAEMEPDVRKELRQLQRRHGEDDPRTLECVAVAAARKGQPAAEAGAASLKGCGCVL